MSASPFAKKTSDQDGEHWELPSPGLHAAVLVGLVDIGTHDHEYQGETSERRSNFVAWELVDGKDSEGNSFFVGQEFNCSLHKKSNWRVLLEGWRGRAFGADEQFDPIVLLGAKCVINLTAKVTGKDKEYMKIGSVATPMKGQAIPEASATPFAWHLDTWGDFTADPPIPEWMPRTYGKTVLSEIKASKEWKAAEAKLNQKEFGGQSAPAAKPNGSPATRHEDPRKVAAAMAASEDDREDPPF